MKKQVKTAIIAAAILLALAVGGVYMVSERLLSGQTSGPSGSDKQVPGKTEEDGKENSPSDKESEEEKLKEEAKGDITFLVMGVDDGERTDTIMLCKYFGETGKISVLSIPRDTRTLIPGYGLDKINHAHVFGGAELSLEAVNNLLNMDVKYHVRVDYALVEEIVDTLGGVEVEVPSGIEGLEPGVQTLNGAEAELFLRHRKGYYNQDLGRISAQQEFLKKTILKMSETRNILKISSMVKSGIDNVDTNIPLRTMLGYTLRLRNIDMEKVQMETLPGTPAMIGGISYIVVDESKIPEVVERLFLRQ
jgi:polyisoprenyl-teichoic acid--peptidoglycan teichoic acid transferase